MGTLMQAGLAMMGLGLAGVFMVLGLLWGAIALLRVLFPVKEEQ